jgi:hypothetical protein
MEVNEVRNLFVDAADINFTISNVLFPNTYGEYAGYITR